MPDEQTGSPGSRTSRLGMLALGFAVGAVVTLIILAVARLT